MGGLTPDIEVIKFDTSTCAYMRANRVLIIENVCPSRCCTEHGCRR